MKHRKLIKYAITFIILILMLVCLTGCSAKTKNDIKNYLNEMEIFQNKSNSYKVSMFKSRVKTSSNHYSYVWTVNAKINNEDVQFYVVETVSYAGPFPAHYLGDTYNYKLAKDVLNDIDLKSFTLNDYTSQRYTYDNNKSMDKNKIEELNHECHHLLSIYELKNTFSNFDEFNAELDELVSIVQNTANKGKIKFEVDMRDQEDISSTRIYEHSISSADDVEKIRQKYTPKISRYYNK